MFIKEQGFEAGWEPDEEDKVSRHFVAVKDKDIVATARCRDTGKSKIRIERIAVRKDCRGKGIGRGLLLYIVQQLKKHNPRRIWLASQLQSVKFYEKCSFKPVSESYDLHGMQHVDMDLK